MKYEGQAFEVGRLLSTPGVAAKFKPEDIAKCHARHIVGDWGDICEHDRGVNAHALEHGERLMSVYEIDEDSLWVITEADRSVTTYLLPEEY